MTATNTLPAAVNIARPRPIADPGLAVAQFEGCRYALTVALAAYRKAQRDWRPDITIKARRDDAKRALHRAFAARSFMRSATKTWAGQLVGAE